MVFVLLNYCSLGLQINTLAKPKSRAPSPRIETKKKNDQLWVCDCSACGLTNFFIVTFQKTIPYECIQECRIYVHTFWGLSKKWLCKKYVGRKVYNTSGFNLRQNFAFACTPSFSPRVIIWLEPVIQLKTQYLVSSQLKKLGIFIGRYTNFEIVWCGILNDVN